MILLAGKAQKHKWTLTDHKPGHWKLFLVWISGQLRIQLTYFAMPAGWTCQCKPDLQTHKVFHCKGFLFAINGVFIGTGLSLPFHPGLFILPDHLFPFLFLQHISSAAGEKKNKRSANNLTPGIVECYSLEWSSSFDNVQRGFQVYDTKARASRVRCRNSLLTLLNLGKDQTYWRV